MGTPTWYCIAAGRNEGGQIAGPCPWRHLCPVLAFLLIAGFGHGREDPFIGQPSYGWRAAGQVPGQHSQNVGLGWSGAHSRGQAPPLKHRRVQGEMQREHLRACCVLGRWGPWNQSAHPVRLAAASSNCFGGLRGPVAHCARGVSLVEDARTKHFSRLSLDVQETPGDSPGARVAHPSLHRVGLLG